MPFLRKKGLFVSSRVLYLPVAEIAPNPAQPRKHFSQEGLEELSASISQHGILQPLSVRRLSDGSYQLVSGERRLRAAKLAGLSHVPCIVVTADEEESSLLALVENLQRRDLDFLEEALALSQLVASCRMTQEEAARRLGKSQSAIANKLRLLRLPPDALTLLRSHGFSERHARALLRLPEESQQLQAAQYMVEHDLTVRASEQYIEGLLLPKAPERKAKFILKDVRLFLNSVAKNLKLVQSAGIPARCRREEDEREITLTITVPKGR